MEYLINSPADVNLTVWNVLGEPVAHLVNKKQETGSYEVSWNSKNVPSGIYFVRLTVKGSENGSGENKTIKKVILFN